MEEKGFVRLEGRARKKKLVATQNKVHQEKLAPGLASQELPPGITLKDLKDAFAMFDFDGSGAFLPP